MSTSKVQLIVIRIVGDAWFIEQGEQIVDINVEEQWT